MLALVIGVGERAARLAAPTSPTSHHVSSFAVVFGLGLGALIGLYDFGLPSVDQLVQYIDLMAAPDREF